LERQIANRFKIADYGRPGDRWLIDTVGLAWRTRILVHIENDLRLRLWHAAEDAAVQVFAANLRDLLLAAPAGGWATMGLDPGYRTGVKVAVVTGTGQVVAATTIYPHEPQRRWDESIAQLARLAREHRAELIAIGNGTASRETDRLGAELIRLRPELELTKVVVSEAGASVYSASAFASQELPGLDVSLRGAVSIARRIAAASSARLPARRHQSRAQALQRQRDPWRRGLHRHIHAVNLRTRQIRIRASSTQ
jgi:uncharacterized protein